MPRPDTGPAVAEPVPSAQHSGHVPPQLEPIGSTGIYGFLQHKWQLEHLSAAASHVSFVVSLCLRLFGDASDAMLHAATRQGRHMKHPHRQRLYVRSLIYCIGGTHWMLHSRVHANLTGVSPGISEAFSNTLFRMVHHRSMRPRPRVSIGSSTRCALHDAVHQLSAADTLPLRGWPLPSLSLGT